MYIFLAVLLIVACSSSFSTEKLSDICFNRERAHYLELGENVVITDKNVSIARRINVSGKNVTLRDYCVLEIETCTSCLISVKFRYLNLRDTCRKRSKTVDTSVCSCDYIWISEPSYEGVSGKPFCGYWNSVSASGKPDPTYRSQTRSVTITFYYTGGRNHEFILYMGSERNQNFYFGNVQDSNSAQLPSGKLTSPFFPAEYPPDVVSEYIVTCLKYPSIIQSSGNGYENHGDNCRIHLLFTDFLLASSSVMEFFEGDQQRIELSSGGSFRPPIILTNSSRLKIRFSANGGQDRGFKALFSFTEGDRNNPFLLPNTDCGGMVEDLGGVITMVNMVTSGRKVFDCVWLIRPPQTIFTDGGQFYLKVNAFAEFDRAELEIREGQISESPLLEKIFHSSAHSMKEHVSSPRTGFYVNLRASFGPSSVLGITFASFHFNKCYTGPEFLCRNHRCIPRKVVCDGFDHCGDNSDEIELCYKDWMRTSTKWERVTPNYYFPKEEHFSELKTATLIFIVSSLGLILFLAILIILLYRMGSRSRQESDIQSRLQTINEFLDDAEIEDIIDDDPPNYEPPPDYEVAMMKTACIFKGHKIGGGSSGEGRVIIIIPEGVSNCSSERANEEKNFQQSGYHPPSVSPPPPYVEDCNVRVTSGTSGEQPEDEAVLQSHYIRDEGEKGVQVNFPEQFRDCDSSSVFSDENFDSLADDKLEENE